MDKEKKQAFKKLLAEIETALSKGDWEVSLFFRNIAASMRKMRDRIHEELGNELHTSDDIDISQLIPEGFVKVYVSLYQTDGQNIKRWLGVLNNIKTLSVGRPVYQEEHAIQTMIKSKPDQRRDGYIVVKIAATDIIPPMGGKIPYDRLNHELLTVREGKIMPENIMEFVHMGVRYKFVNGELQKI